MEYNKSDFRIKKMGCKFFVQVKIEQPDGSFLWEGSKCFGVIPHNDLESAKNVVKRYLLSKQKREQNELNAEYFYFD